MARIWTNCIAESSTSDRLSGGDNIRCNEPVLSCFSKVGNRHHNRKFVAIRAKGIGEEWKNGSTRSYP